MLFGVLLVPAFGLKTSLLVVCAGYLLLTLASAPPPAAAWATAALALAAALWAPPLRIVDVPDGGSVLSYLEGPTAAVSVVEDAAGIRRLHIDNRQQEGSSGTLLADARQAILPLLLHAAPREALFLGYGTGLTAGSAAADRDLSVDAVELLPEVIASSHYFTAALGDGGPSPRLQVLAADARRYVRAGSQYYDVIVSDNFHPARSGSGSLYTVEHFAAVRERLEADGLFCQWLPLHQLDLDTLRIIVRSFLEVYPDAWAVLATNSLETPVLGLVARRDGQRFSLQSLRGRLAHARFTRSPVAFGFADELSVLGRFVAGPQALARFAGDAVLNTDDRPVVANRAPRITYAPDSVPRDRLLELLQQLSLEPIQLVDGATDSEWTRLSAYWRARDEFLAAGRNVRPSADVRDMLAQVREPLLAVLGTSPDFRPAYDPLLDMAEALATVDPAAACRLLGDLSSVQPARPEAATAMSGLSCPSHNCVAGPCEASCPDSRKLHERLPHPQ